MRSEDRLCWHPTCTFRKTCKKWDDNHFKLHEGDPDDTTYNVLLEHECDTKKWTCYESYDGKLL